MARSNTETVETRAEQASSTKRSTAIPTMMPAWQWAGTGRPLVLNQVPVPQPGTGEVLINVRAAGMCHTDVGALDEPTWADSVTSNPRTLGHEVAGVIVKRGADVAGWQLGQRVAVYPSGVTVPGFSRDGGYAPYMLAPVADLVEVPDGLDFTLAAMSTDAGMTSHKAVVTTGEVRAGTRVGIIGIGGLGQIGAQIAVGVGAEVYAADTNAVARADAAAWGLAGIVDSAEGLIGLGLDVVVDFAGFGSTTLAALRAIRVGGTIVMVGLGAEDTTLKTREVVHQRATIRGSQAGTKEDIVAVQELLADGAVRPRVELIDFASIPIAIERLRAGDVAGRLVMIPDSQQSL